VAVFLVRINRRVINLVFLGALTLVNLKYYFSDKWFYQMQDILVVGKPIPYSLQLAATNDIISDAKGAALSLKRVGEYDYFEENYAQNYRYLLWLKGNEPVIGSGLVYTIIENVQSGKLIVTKTYDKAQ